MSRDLRATLDAVLEAMLEFRNLDEKGEAAFKDAVLKLESYGDMIPEDQSFARTMFTFGYSRGVREVVEATNNAIEASNSKHAVAKGE